jgi:hypothetical protein
MKFPSKEIARSFDSIPHAMRPGYYSLHLQALKKAADKHLAKGKKKIGNFATNYKWRRLGFKSVYVFLTCYA